MHINTISFPGLGIGPFNISPTAFNLLGRNIAWYGILISIGIISGLFYAIWRGKQNGIKPDDMTDIAIFSIPLALVGARLYYVVFNLSMYKSFYEVIAVWQGGLAVYGSIIFGALTAFFVCKYKKLSALTVFDSAMPGIMLGQVIGRWGNFTNGEAFGSITTLPWRMTITGDYADPSAALGVHPTFLYESLWNLLGFILINIFYKKKKFNGQICLMYITWYGFGRMFIEGLRSDSLYVTGSASDFIHIGGFSIGLRVSQLLAFLCFAVGLAALLYFLSRAKRLTREGSPYSSQFAAAGGAPIEASADLVINAQAETAANRNDAEKAEVSASENESQTEGEASGKTEGSKDSGSNPQ